MSPALPRGIEVLLKKASVDPDFRVLLLENPDEAATSIELQLDPMEQAMLRAMPTGQLETIIDRTEVPQPQRRAFLGSAAAAMLAVLGGLAGCKTTPKGPAPPLPTPTGGSRPNDPPDYPPMMKNGGSQPDYPPMVKEGGSQPDYPHSPRGGSRPDDPTTTNEQEKPPEQNDLPTLYGGSRPDLPGEPTYK